MKTLTVPAERWNELAAVNSCQLAVEHQGKGAISVRAIEHDGFMITAFATLYGPYGESRKSYVDAYRLLPAEMYEGETTLVYHDEEAIQAGRRGRGDHTGLMVSIKGKLMVCAQKLRIFMGLPGTRPLSLAEASAHDEHERSMGWRALWFESRTPEWFSLSGHPVAVYRHHKTLGEDHAVLIWKSRGAIHEMSIDDDVPLEAIQKHAPAGGYGQLALF